MQVKVLIYNFILYEMRQQWKILIWFDRTFITFRICSYHVYRVVFISEKSRMKDSTSVNDVEK